MCTTGPPGIITDLNVSLPDSACSIIVRWNEASSNPVCGRVWYNITIISPEGGTLITDYTNETTVNYNVSILNHTKYTVTVIAINNAGSCNPASVMMNGKFNL